MTDFLHFWISRSVIFHRQTEGMMIVFNLGDSRTGTTSVHEYLLRGGLKSIHYFVRDAGVAEPIHKFRAANWEKLRNFIVTSGYEAFSDYPIRLFHRELAEHFPDAYFVLTVRESLATWRESMRILQPQARLDFDLLQAYYLCYNEEIRCNCAELGRRFLELVIEDDARVNARRLRDFLGLHDQGPLLQLNGAKEYATCQANR
jgi:hypothetical protein